MMVELINTKVTATEATELLLTRCNPFIKDLSSKIKRENRQFLRIAIRNEAEDDVVVKALGEILSHWFHFSDQQQMEHLKKVSH